MMRGSIFVLACLCPGFAACRSTAESGPQAVAETEASTPSLAPGSAWHAEDEWRGASRETLASTAAPTAMTGAPASSATNDATRASAVASDARTTPTTPVTQATSAPAVENLSSTAIGSETQPPAPAAFANRPSATSSENHSSPADAPENRSSVNAADAAARASGTVRATEAALSIDHDEAQQAVAVALEVPKNEFYEVSTGDGPLRMYRGDGEPPIEIPRDEQLFYEVSINLGILGSLTVGQVILSSGVEAYVPGLPLPGEPAPKPAGREVGWIHSLASGYYLGYRLVHNLDVRLLPQDWPHLYYRDAQNGTENRRSELRIGRFNGEYTASYLADHHCTGCNNPAHFVKAGFMWQNLEHCHKCKLAEHRVWLGPQSRTVPPGSSDLLSAVFLARTMVEDGRSEIVIPVVNEQKLWSLTVRAGEHKTVSTPSGDFACVMITLATTIPPGEPRDEKSFSGLFGIRGDIRIWMDEKTGVPVVIQGDLPVPVIGKLEVDVELKKYAGTPKTFVPR
jgi:Protein of unknown function (DUF3108)